MNSVQSRSGQWGASGSVGNRLVDGLVNGISERDMTVLAQLSSHIIHGIDFPEVKLSQDRHSRLAGCLDDLETRYGNSELLFNARTVFASQPINKIALYRFTRNLIRNLPMSRASNLVSNAALDKSTLH